MTGEAPSPSRVRRMLPSVSEVLKELTSRASVEPDVAFRAAREVCAEELKRIRDAGGDSVPLEELVQRAYRRATGGTLPGVPAPPLPPPPAPPAFVPVEEPAAFELAGEPEPPVLPSAPAVEEPFAETTGAMDLRWEGEPRGPFAEAHAPVPPSPGDLLPPDAPTVPEAVLVPPADAAPLSFPDVPPVPFALPADEPAVPDGGVSVLPEDVEGPGDETLSRLSREAQAIDLQEVFPKPGEAAPVPFAVAATSGGEPLDEAPPPPFEDEEDTVLTVPGRGRGRKPAEQKRPRWGLLLGTAAALAAAAGLGYLLVGLWMERDAAPAPVAVARPRVTPTPAAATPAEPVPPVAAPAEPAPAAVSAPEASAPAPAPVSTVVPAPAPSPLPTAAPVATLPAATPAAPRPAAAVARSRDGLVVTRDRAGRPTVFSIHFTSYRDRASAEKDLKRIASLVGRDGYVAEVDLGEKGVWQRVMIGAFPTAAEAKAVREELLAKGTRDMGWVYRVVGPEADAPR